MIKFAILLVLLSEQNSLSLADCIREALTRHPDVALSQIEVERADAQKLGTRAGYLPHLNLQIQDGYSAWGKTESQQMQLMGQTFIQPAKAADGDDFHSFGLSLSQNLYDGGKWWNQVSRAERQRSRALSGVAVVREDVALRVILAFYQVTKLGRQEEVLKEALALSRDQMQLAEERKTVGAASKVDVAKARVSVGEDQVALERQRVLLESARVDLLLSLGRKDLKPVTLLESAEADPVFPKEDDGVMDRHARLRENAQAEAVADLDVSIAEGGRWPVIQGNINYSRQDSEFYKVYSRFDMIYNLTFSLNISFPIFDGFLTKANIESARVARDAVVVQGEQVQQQLNAEANRRKSEIVRLQSVARLQSDNVKAALQQLELAQERYQLGDGTSLEVRDAQLAVTRAKLNEVQTQVDIRNAVAQFHHAKGDLLNVYLGEERP
jgi:outer membrane protein